MPTLRYVVAEESSVKIALCDATGATVLTLLDGERREAGSYTLAFDASKLAAGTYFVHVAAGAQRVVKPLVIAR